MQVHAAVELFHACHLLMTAPPLLPSVSSLQSLPTSVHASWELPGCSGLGPISPDAAQLHLAGALTASVCYRPHQPWRCAAAFGGCMDCGCVLWQRLCC